MKSITTKKSYLRLAIQVFFFVLIATVAIGHSLAATGISLGIFSAASVHAVCPFGGVVSIYQFATFGTFVQKIHESAFILMFIVFGIALFVGPAFCGWVCPLGSIQEWLGKLGRKIRKQKYNNLIPHRIDKYLRYLRYVVLLWVIIATATSAVLVFSDYDPYFALFNFWTGEVAISGLIILGIVLLLSLFVERPFCKYACPYGAVLGLFNFVRIFKIKRNPATCIDCHACDTACPMNIRVSDKENIRDHQCISCLKCTSEFACPVTNTTELMTGKFKEAE